METLAYLHLSVANEEPADTNYTLRAIWKNPQLLTLLNSPRFSTRAAVPLLSLTVALGILGLARQAFALAKPGDRSSEVTALQQRLQKLGYFKGPTTGYYGPLTKQAVLRYQQAKGLTPDGMVGTSTQASFGEHHKQAVEEPSHPIWKIGDRDSKVSEIQNTLAAAGYPSSTSGVFDQETAEAVRLFQQAKGLKVDGIVGKQTLAALSEQPQSEKIEKESKLDESKLDDSKPSESKLDDSKPNDFKANDFKANDSKPNDFKANDSKPNDFKANDFKANDSKAESKKTMRWESIEEPDNQAVEESSKSAWQIGDRGSKVREIQKKLVAAGFQSGADGFFDEKTTEAIRLFQRSKGLRVDGIVGQETLAALSGNPKTESKPEPQNTTPWYEDKSAPLAPFTR